MASDSNNLIEDTEGTSIGEEPKTKKKSKNPFKIQQEKEERERRQKKRARVVVRNISFKANEESLKKHFEQWGTLEEVKLLKRPDGKLVGVAFLQYESINQAKKAILKGDKSLLVGRPVNVDWALGKDEYKAKKGEEADKDIKPKIEVKDENESGGEEEKLNASIKSEESDDEEKGSDNEEESDEDDDDEEENSDQEESESDEEDSKDKSKLDIAKVKKEKAKTEDVKEGCTVFIKNVPFDAEDNDLRKLCRKFGPLYYTIINREPISGHSKGSAFVKFKSKDSADLCLQAGEEFTLMDQVLQPYPALSREEITKQKTESENDGKGKDSRNLYLAREGLIMSGSKAAEGVSASDMAKRHKLEQMKTQVLKNLDRFVSRNRLSIHNLPLTYDDEKLKQLIIAHTNYKPHECRVMRENRITPDHPKGKSKGFGFMSFSTHQQALTALRKLNNNPTVFGPLHRPIVAFSIEDRAVHKIKEKRTQKSKLNNPTYQAKLERRKEARAKKTNGKLPITFPKGPQNDDKTKLKQHIKQLEQARADKAAGKSNAEPEEHEKFVGTAAKPGSNIRLRSNKKIREQADEHKKRVKADKRRDKQRKIKQMHLAERKSIDRPKQGRKVERDDISHLVNKYKRMLDGNASHGATGSAAAATADGQPKAKKPKRTKWYKE